MRTHAHVGAEGDFHPGLVGLARGLLDQRADARGLGAHDLGEVAVDLRLVGDEAPGVDGRHVPGAVLLHQVHHPVAHVGAVLDAGHAAFDRAGHAFLAVRVGGHAVAVILGGIDDRADFLDGELRGVAGLGVAEHAAGGGDLDHVAAVLVALAHGLAGVVDGVDHALGGAGRAEQVRKLGVVAVGGVGVPAGGGDGLARGEDPRPLHQALVDRVAQVRGHLASEVAHAGEAGQQGLFGIADAAEGVIHVVQAETFGIALRAGLAAQVHVQVGPAGGAGVAGQVDGPRARHVGPARQDLGHLARAHDHGPGIQQPAAAAVEQVAAVQRDVLGRGGGDRGRAGQEGQQYGRQQCGRQERGGPAADGVHRVLPGKIRR